MKPVLSPPFLSSSHFPKHNYPKTTFRKLVIRLQIIKMIVAPPPYKKHRSLSNPPEYSSLHLAKPEKTQLYNPSPHPAANKPNPSLSSRIKHSLNINPGFCPGAWQHRLAVAKESSYIPFDKTKPCKHCGLLPVYELPESFKEDWKAPARPRLPCRFFFEQHVPVKQDGEEKRGCMICWEHEKIWVEPMAAGEWGTHMRTHFEKEGYWTCKTASGMIRPKAQCGTRKCRGVH